MKRAQDYKTKIEAKDQIRNAEELLQQYRRRMVLEGKWTEFESHIKLQEKLDEIYEKFPTESSFKIYQREQRKRMENLFSLGVGYGVKEREYYFDEGLG